MLYRLLILSPLFLPASLVTLLLPQVVSLRYFHPPMTAYVFERSWERLGAFRMEWRPLAQMPEALKDAVVAAEDANFYRHHGVDFKEMRASWKKNQRKKKYARGFSTITMQLARNLFLTPHKNILRKGLEIAIALEMEAVLPKDRILELYLNLIEWGDGVYGAESAAEHYFKRPVASLTPDESAFLAAIIPSPRKWGRWPPGPYVRNRQAVLLSRIGARSARGAVPETAPAEPIPDLPNDSDDGGI